MQRFENVLDCGQREENREDRKQGTAVWLVQPEAVLLGAQSDAAACAGLSRSSFAAAPSTEGSLKKLGFASPQNRTGLSNTKSRKSSGVIKPSSTSSCASMSTSAMSTTSKCPMSDPNRVLSRALWAFVRP